MVYLIYWKIPEGETQHYDVHFDDEKEARCVAAELNIVYPDKEHWAGRAWWEEDEEEEADDER